MRGWARSASAADAASPPVRVPVGVARASVARRVAAALRVACEFGGSGSAIHDAHLSEESNASVALTRGAHEHDLARHPGVTYDDLGLSRVAFAVARTGASTRYQPRLAGSAAALLLGESESDTAPPARPNHSDPFVAVGVVLDCLADTLRSSARCAVSQRDAGADPLAARYSRSAKRRSRAGRRAAPEARSAFQQPPLTATAVGGVVGLPSNRTVSWCRPACPLLDRRRRRPCVRRQRESGLRVPALLALIADGELTPRLCGCHSVRDQPLERPLRSRLGLGLGGFDPRERPVGCNPGVPCPLVVLEPPDVPATRFPYVHERNASAAGVLAKGQLRGVPVATGSRDPAPTAAEER
jgi:hypothetical protein